MNACPACTAELVDADGGSTRRCLHCGWLPMDPAVDSAAEPEVPSTLDGTRLSGKSMDFHCPVCPDQSLTVATIAETQVCGCQQCRGFLIDSASLGVLIADLRREYRGADDRPKLMDADALQHEWNCPTCFEKMYTHPYYGPGTVVINSCSECQLNWLDEGEFTSIIRAPGKR